MPFAPHIVASLETILSDGFGFHNGLDVFVTRAGLPRARLAAARKAAEERVRNSSKAFSRAPKRYVAQEILTLLDGGTPDDDRIMASLVTAALKLDLKAASEGARTAQEELKKTRAEERNEAEERRTVERTRQEEGERSRHAQSAKRAAQREKFKEDFILLSKNDHAQSRGYLLEIFLNGFFAFEDLNPRASFKIVGEQIDGSFSWASRTHLVEAKWISEPVAGAGFGGLMYKIEGKTADTRGLFISINGYSPQAIIGLKQKGELRFICIDGAHIMRCLSPGGSLPKLLDILWRHASETGEPYMPVSAITSPG